MKDFDEVVLASGVKPRLPDIEGIGHEKTLSYIDVLLGDAQVGKQVAIIGAGGIGFDVAEFLGHEHHNGPDFPTAEEFARQWGIDMTLEARGREWREWQAEPPAAGSRYLVAAAQIKQARQRAG